MTGQFHSISFQVAQRIVNVLKTLIKVSATLIWICALVSSMTCSKKDWLSIYSPVNHIYSNRSQPSITSDSNFLRPLLVFLNSVSHKKNFFWSNLKFNNFSAICKALRGQLLYEANLFLISYSSTHSYL